MKFTRQVLQSFLHSHVSKTREEHSPSLYKKEPSLRVGGPEPPSESPSKVEQDSTPTSVDLQSEQPTGAETDLLDSIRGGKEHDTTLIMNSEEEHDELHHLDDVSTTYSLVSHNSQRSMNLSVTPGIEESSSKMSMMDSGTPMTHLSYAESSDDSVVKLLDESDVAAHHDMLPNPTFDSIREEEEEENGKEEPKQEQPKIQPHYDEKVALVMTKVLDDDISQGDASSITGSPSDTERILEDFDVDTTTPAIYIASMEAHVHAYDVRTKHKVVLKFMKDLKPFTTELTSRVDVDYTFILPVKRVIVDSAVSSDPLLIQTGHIIKQGIEKLENVSEEIHTFLSKLVRKTWEAGSDNVPVQDTIDYRYPYVLCLEGYDGTLEDYTKQNSIPSITLTRKVTRDVVMGLISLHSEERIHGSLKPRSIVRVGSTWKLTDLYRSTPIQQPYDLNQLSVAHCPPEVAHILLEDKKRMSDTTTHLYLADTSLDLWSFGCILFALVMGSALLLPKLSSVSQWSLDTFLQRAYLHLPPDDRSDDEWALVDLVSKLLMPTAEDRRANFELGIVGINEHEFVRAVPLETDTFMALRERQLVMSKKDVDRKRYLDLTDSLTLEEKWELNRARDVLLLGIFEHNAVHTPTSFVILCDKLPPVGTEESTKVTLNRLENAFQWIDLCQSLGSYICQSLTEVNVSTIGRFWKKVGSTFPIKDYIYLYFIDDLTGEIARDQEGEGYPLEIKNKSDILPKLLPLMEVTMRSMALYHGVTGIARMFGCPSIDISDEIRMKFQPTVDKLKIDNYPSAFGLLSEDAANLRINKAKYFKSDKIRCLSLNVLVHFIEKKLGRDGNFGGLIRIENDKGLALWTNCATTEHVRQAILNKAEERLKEEQALWKVSQDKKIYTLENALAKETETSQLMKEMFEVSDEEVRKLKSENSTLQSTIDELKAKLSKVESKLRKQERWSSVRNLVKGKSSPSKSK